MIVSFRKFRGLVCVLYLSCLQALAQVTHQAPGSVPPLPEAPLDFSLVKSPVSTFRELLNMDPAERAKALADRPEETRKRIMAKIREYKSLKPDECDLRLKVTELGYYLRWLMRAPATNRAAQIALIPAGYRDLVQVRLVKWDRLAPAAQQKLLQNEAAIRAMTELTNGISTNAIPIRSLMLQNTVSNWNRLPDKDKKELSENFDYFFQLKAAERQKAARILTKEEQAQIAVTLRKFLNLSPDQRTQCIQSFEKLAAMSPSDRRQFFKNAERWEMMTPKERDDWRNLVETAPLLPPMNSLPPLPHTAGVPQKGRYATNAQGN
jgi:hypothetical protein